MPETLFFVNTAMICYNCRRVAVIRMKQSWRRLALIAPSSEALDVIFVSCTVCLDLPGVHHPYISVLKKYVDPQGYSTTIGILEHIFGCSPSFLVERKFSITALKMKNFAQVRDITEVYYMPTVPDRNIMILKDGLEMTTDSRFFWHDPAMTSRTPAGYKCSGVFADVANRPRVYGSNMFERLGSDVPDPPPPYREIDQQ